MKGNFADMELVLVEVDALSACVSVCVDEIAVQGIRHGGVCREYVVVDNECQAHEGIGGVDSQSQVGRVDAVFLGCWHAE